MFTGIIEEVGTLKGIRHGQKSSVVTVGGKKVLIGTKIGDSISTNGVCLTVTKLHKDAFDADVMPETLQRSNLGALQMGGRVNLERALQLDTRLGGHIVSGHIDGTGSIKEYRTDDNAVWITISAGPELLRYIIEKGSIAIDGVSLTVATVDNGNRSRSPSFPIPERRRSCLRRSWATRSIWSATSSENTWKNCWA